MAKKYQMLIFIGKDFMKDIKISILILTHKRPELFKRCINSVLKNKPDDVEILVNNDSNDIEEIPGATYYYKQDNNLSNIYNFLMKTAQGEYLYFLEDDDYVVPNFWNILLNDIKTNKTLFYNYIPHNGMLEYINRFKDKINDGNYSKEDFLQIVQGKYLYFLEDDDYVVPNFWNILLNDIKTDKTLFYNYIPHNGMLEYINRFKNKTDDGNYSKEDFLQIVQEEHFQISQMCFRKNDITEYMIGNFLDNDWKLFIGINNDIYYNSIPIFIQTIDGKDNISFEKYNTDVRFKGQH